MGENVRLQIEFDNLPTGGCARFELRERLSDGATATPREWSCSMRVILGLLGLRGNIRREIDVLEGFDCPEVNLILVPAPHLATGRPGMTAVCGEMVVNDGVKLRVRTS